MAGATPQGHLVIACSPDGRPSRRIESDAEQRARELEAKMKAAE
ncbi:MAG TPA: hypothetical protein VLQ93_12580 [Myxococcaceae bacterium]|nr:hypothetical protein [Myxococcaceae bacterium]